MTSLKSFILSFVAFISAVSLPSIQTVAFCVSIGAGLFSMANVVYNIRKDIKNKNQNKTDK